VKISSRYDNEVSFFKEQIGVEIGGNISPRLITLYPADYHHGRTVNLASDSIHCQLMVGVFKIPFHTGVGREVSGKYHYKSI
jgi:hypothetical protein